MRIDNVYEMLKKLCLEQDRNLGRVHGVSAREIAARLNLQRTNVSSDLNKLCLEEKIAKTAGKPVLYRLKESDILAGRSAGNFTDAFGSVIGAELSLKNAVRQAKAAIIYPPKGLHTLLLGETGTGKSMFAEIMFEFAKDEGRIKRNAPFVAFNCADYAHNPQLLMSQLFGVRKGAYTGADRERSGIVEKADGGILFLDEVHRLPPEGQEMLFFLIDKGLYMKLGETEAQHRAEILIICATTENVESTLLKTFTRRIPMAINLPPLKDRTFKERYELVEYFFNTEASRIATEIVVTPNVMKAFLLYDCQANIGQLKSDVKLCCAKAFLSFIMKREGQVWVHSEDLPDYIRRGLFKYKENKDKIDRYVGDGNVTFAFGKNERNMVEEGGYNFYEALEEKLNVLELNGLDDKEIKLIMGLDIETYLKKYLLNAEKKNLEDLYKLVDKRIVNIVDDFLVYASKKLKREFSPRILHGLSMHIASSIERLSKGKAIQNHQLEEIKRSHKAEYELAQGLKKKLQNEFKVDFPEDEVGFIAMLLSLDEEKDKSEEGVGVLVAMHGESTATSMVNVCNRLLGVDYAVGYNMPLEQKPETALEEITALVKKLDRGKGVLLMVDMGSLVFFGDMIRERLGIPVKTVRMVSTLTVIEAGRKAMLSAPLEEVYRSVSPLQPGWDPLPESEIRPDSGEKEDVVITACLTGEGTALKLKSILENKFNLGEKNIEVIPIDIASQAEYRRRIKRIAREKNVLAVVSAIKPDEDSLPYLSTTDLLDERKIEKVKEKIEALSSTKLIANMTDVIRENVRIDADKFGRVFQRFHADLRHRGVRADHNTLTGLMLHIACVIERVQSGKELHRLKNYRGLIRDNPERFRLVRETTGLFEHEFAVQLSDAECVSIMRILFAL
ncbi:nitrogen assimilation regulatory protein [Peptococcaceae bacterium CEB3]|nr:nitrogen assimilation regulatory protein [Peptococcaceae bacterium CEB3]